MNQQKCCIIVPCFNEESRLHIDRFKDFIHSHPSIKLCFANDGSSDGTVQILEQLKIDAPQCEIIDFKQNQGKAQVIANTMTKLLNDSNFAEYDWFGYWDADLATPLEEIPRFMDKLSSHPKVHFIMGSRINRLGTNINRKWYRHYLGRTFATFVSIALKLPVYDTQCGAKIISRELCSKIFSKPLISKWIFDVELFFRTMKIINTTNKKEMFYEVSLNSWEDVDGSKLKPTDFLKAPLELIKIYRTYR